MYSRSKIRKPQYKVFVSGWRGKYAVDNSPLGLPLAPSPKRSVVVVKAKIHCAGYELKKNPLYRL